MRVLIVSEDPRERARAATALALEDDVEIIEVDSAAAAREALLGAPADVLVIDGDLTPKGGFSMLYELRASSDLAGTAEVPALVMVERTTDQWLAQWARANTTLPKPVDPFALAKAVRRLVGKGAPEPA